MSVKQISINELKKMTDSEGLIFQGCGGNLQEWVDGINDILTEEGILLNSSRFKEVYVFEHEGLTNLLFKMSNDVKLDIGKLSMWRLRTHENFNGKWLSDYLMNRLGIDATNDSNIVEQSKPDCPIIGADGIIYNILGIVKNTLDKCDMTEEFNQLWERVKQGDYNNALAIIMEYVNPVSVSNQQTINNQI